MNPALKQSTRRKQVPSPEELFERYRQGDRESLEALYDHFEQQLFGFAARLLGSPEDGAEALQELWYRAHRSREDWRAGTSVRSWLFGILRNLCFDLLRRRRHEPLLLVEDEEQVTDLQRQSALAAWYATWSNTALDPSFRRAVEQGLQQLAPVYRVLLLYAFDDWSYAEMAEKEGLSEHRVKSRLYRARELLKEYLLGCGYAPASQALASPREEERHA